jgi:poly(A) polymerase
MFDTESGEFVAATRICKLIQDNGYEAVLAGGCVRDHLMGVPFNDIDIATNADLDYLTPLLNSKGIQTKYVGKAFGVTLARVNGYEFEIARFRKDIDCDGRHPGHVEFCSMEEDALRRDFTINAIFHDPITDNYIDYVGGIKDLLHKKLRFVGNPEDRIREDYLRILRYVRFYNMGFHIDKCDLQIVESYAFELIKNVSAERIRIELMDKIFPTIRCMEKPFLIFPNLMNAIFGLNDLKEVPQSPKWHPEGDVYFHTLLTVEKLLRNGCNAPLVILAGIFHDFGKKEKTKLIDGDWRSPGHELASEEIVREWMSSFKFSNDDIEYVTWLVRNHMKLHYPGLKKSSLKRIMIDGDINALLALTLADCQAASGDLTEYIKYNERVNEILSEGTFTRPPPLVTGRDLIQQGLKPGPMFKKLLDYAYDRQLDEESITKENLMQEVMENAKQQEQR